MHDIKARVISTVRAIAATEEHLAETFAQMAEDRPARAARLRAMSDTSKAQATHFRQWADDHSQPPADLGLRS